MACWIVVGSEENMRIAESRGWDIFGFKSTRRGEAARIQPGDILIFYLTKIMKFGGMAEVTSGVFEDHERVFVSTKKPKEDYPFRVRIKPLISLTPGAVPRRQEDRPDAGVHEEVAAAALAPCLPGQPPRGPEERLRADQGLMTAAVEAPT